MEMKGGWSECEGGRGKDGVNVRVEEGRME